MKRCQSCGRLIELLEDFAGLDQSGNYCSSCADDSGKIKPFEEVLDNLTQRIAKTDGFDESASRNAALQILGRQPAWEPRFKREENVKNNRRKVVLALVAVVFALSAGGAAWWFTSRYYQNKDQPNKLHLSGYANPFKDVAHYKNNGFEITEFRCKGDQRLTSFEDGIMDIDSYDTSTKVNIEDYFELYPSYETSKNTVYINRQALANSKKGNNSNNYALESFDTNVKLFRDKIEYSSYRYYCNTGCYEESNEQNMLIADTQSDVIQYLTIKQQNSQSKETNQGNSLTIYENYDKAVLKLSSMKNNRFHRELYLYNEANNNLINLASAMDFSLLGYYKSMVVLDCSGFENEPNNKYYAILNMDNGHMKLLSNDIHFLMISTNKIYYYDSTNSVYEYNYSSDKISFIKRIPYGYDISEMIKVEGQCYLLLLKTAFGNSKENVEQNYSEHNILDEGFYITKVVDDAIIKLNINYKSNLIDLVGQYYIWAENGNGVYSLSRLYQSPKELHCYVSYETDSKGNLYATDTTTNKTILISENVLIRDVRIDGNFIAWTKYAGSKDDQWKNVCYTRIPETK